MEQHTKETLLNESSNGSTSNGKAKAPFAGRSSLGGALNLVATFCRSCFWSGSAQPPVSNLTKSNNVDGAEVVKSSGSSYYAQEMRQR